MGWHFYSSALMVNSGIIAASDLTDDIIDLLVGTAMSWGLTEFYWETEMARLVSDQHCSGPFHIHY